MKKNVASQAIGVQMITASDGTAFTGAVTIYVTGDGGTQAIGSVGSGLCTHEGNGFHTYVPAQAETNYDHIGFTFIGTGAIPATLQVYTTFPQSVDHASALATAQADLDIITGADGAALASTQQSITFQPIVITAADGVANITLAGSGAADGFAFTRSGAGDLFGANWAAAIDALLDIALANYDAATGTELAATEAKIDIIDANVDAILTDTGTTLPAQISALNDTSVSDILTTQMTEAYAADGVAPTLAQAIFLIQQTIGDFSISGTTLTAKKLDGTTAAATYTLDDAVTPTSRTRAT